jgi:hypothetical protein
MPDSAGGFDPEELLGAATPERVAAYLAFPVARPEPDHAPFPFGFRLQVGPVAQE